MDRPRRSHAQARAEMREGILRLGREQVAERGAAQLSVREIARGLGVASSAIYRHVASRDDLLTMLLVDAYDDLAATALAAASSSEPASVRLDALARSMRSWAVADPARWGLIYGTPVPGYAAPRDSTVAPGTRVLAEFVGLLSSGRMPPESDTELGSQLVTVMGQGLQDLGLEVDPVMATEAAVAWAGLVGLISAEVFQQFGPEFHEVGEELLHRWVEATVARFGLQR
jgi:AcrR family transcriptional regulator